MYALFSVLWILGSDRVLALLAQDRTDLLELGTYKGWLYVAITSALLYGLLRRQPVLAPAGQHAAAGSLRPWLVQFGVAVLVIGIVTAAAMSASYRRHRVEVASRLEVVAALQAAQVSHWLSEHIAQARFVGGSTLGRLAAQWRDAGDLDARDQLASRLSSVLQAGMSRQVLVVDRAGRAIGPTGEIPGVAAPELLSAVARALDSGEIQFTDPYRTDSAAGDLQLDVVAPLMLSGAPAHAVVVLQLDPRAFLVPTLNHWPLPDRKASAVLLGRDGRALLDTEGMPTRQPAIHPEPGGVPGRAHSLLDERGGKVMAVVQSVAGTGWTLVARIDEAEIAAYALDDALWIAAVGVMAAVACAIGMFLLREREALQLKRVETEQQAEKLQALQLLQSIADTSMDAIYAKDRAGRYLLFSREAERRVGKPAREVLGQGDDAIFPPAQAEVIISSDRMVMETGQPLTYERELDTVDGKPTLQVIKSPLRDPAGQVIGVFGISRDISARLRVERALRDTSQLAQAAGDSMIDHMAVLDAQGVIVAVNRAWRRFDAGRAAPRCDVLPRSGVGCNYVQVARSQDSAQAVLAGKGIQDVLDGREPVFTMEYCCHPNDAAEQWFVIKVTPLKIAQGGAIVLHSDITELKHNAAELTRYRHQLEELVKERTGQLERSNRTVSEGERFVRTLTDNVPAILSYWGRDMRCRFANRQNRERFRLGPEMIGMKLRAVMGRDGYQSVRHHVRNVLNGQRCQYEIRFKDLSGTEVDYLMNLIPDMVDGRAQGFFVMASEVTRLENGAGAAGASQRGPGHRTRPGRSRQPRQERLSGQHEP